ncbi:MAG TPA: hypothetical protein VJ420_09180 [Candidatus Udaeobacter sp.]|nr:hypothetical protein [Candidatus Udaeobacter sp.]
MKAAALKPAFVSCVAIAILLYPSRGVFAQSRGTIKLNKDASAFAARLIKEGHVITDGKGAWSKHRPSADEENEFIRLHGFGEYAKWHLGIDERYGANAKRRYKFPYGDFMNVHRCGVLAVRSRAAEYRYSDIEDTATRLIEMIRQRQ